MTSIIKVDQIQTAAGGVPTAGDLGLNMSGSVLQVVSNQSDTSPTWSSGGGDSTFSNVISASITPHNSSSKIKITTCGIYYANTVASSVNHRFRLVRDGSPLSDYNGQQDNGTAQYLQYRTSAVNNHIPVPFNFTWINSPSTSSPVTYTLQAIAALSSLYFYGGMYIFLEEIAG